MDFSFLNVLNTSIAASWLVLAVLGLRLLLKKAPKAIHCALWALVAIRLLCPVSIQSPVSLMPSSQTISPDYLYEPAVHSTAQTVLEIVDNPIYPEPVSVVLDTSVSRLSVWGNQWSVVWLAGVGIMGLYALISWLRLRRRVSASIPIGSNIRLCDYIDSPFILGIFRPLIYLPSDMDQETMDHVLAHEQSHLQRRDHCWKPLGFLLLSIHWFNPVMWTAYILLCRDIELACDERVIRDLTADRKKAYSTALLRCSVSRRQIAACPLAFGETGVKERVKNVLNYKKPAFWVIVLAILLCAAVAVCFLTDPVPPEEESPVTLELPEDGVWVSEEKIYWKGYSALYCYKMEMNITDGEVFLRFNDGEWSEGPFQFHNGWQRESPITQRYRELLAELTDIEPTFAPQDLSDCLFLELDARHFLVQKGDALYVVSWMRSNVGIEMVDYIFHVVPEEMASKKATFVIGTYQLEMDPIDEAIGQYFLEHCTMASEKNTYTSVSFQNYGTAYRNPDAPAPITRYLSVRIAHFTQNPDGSVTESSWETFSAIFYISENPDGTYSVADCVRDDAEYDSSNLVLETECWRQAYSYFQPTLESEINAIVRNHPDYLKKDTTNGLDLVWWNTPEGVRCVVLSGLQRARTSADAKIHTPLTVQETIAVLQLYKVPVSAMLTHSSSALAIYQIDSP